MTEKDLLLELLIDFFELPSSTPPGNLNASTVSKWDSLAMVRLITELQSTFALQFDLEELEHLSSYDEIRNALRRKGVSLQCTGPS
jgi:acyl carrier protein